MYAPESNAANFTGVLVKTKYKPGHNYAQMLFKTDDGLKLSISHNLSLVRSLKIGSTYKIKGREYSVNQKSFIYEPSTKLVRPKKNFILAGSGIMTVAFVIVAALTLPSKNSSTTNNNSQQHTKKESKQTKQVLETSNVTTISPPSQDPQFAGDSGPAPTPVKKSAPKPTTSSNSTTNTQTTNPTAEPTNPPTTPPPAPEPTPEPTPTPPPPPPEPPVDPPPTESPTQTP